MKNQPIILLPLLLFFFTSIQCMQRNYSSLIDKKTNTFYRMEDIYDEIEGEIFDACLDLRTRTPLMEEHHRPIITWCTNNNELLETQKNFNYQGYSFLGLATICRDERYEVTFYTQKKEFIKKLLDFGFKPTKKDLELALIEKWERCLPIIKNICLINCAYKNNNSLVQIPDVLINYISLLMFETEESLL